MSGWMFLLEGCLVSGLILSGLITVYLAILSIAAVVNPARRAIRGLFRGPREASTRFIVLIPAHNEALVIGEILRRVRDQTYPASHYEVVVIADNCTDTTAIIAAGHGVQVLARTDTAHRGKGQALNWAMRERLAQWPRPYDAVIVMDADSVMNPDFLWFMDAECRAGHELLQAYYGVLNPLDNWRTSLATAAFAAFHFLRPLGRMRLGLSCGLKGNGMLFSRRLVETYGYPAFSIVEDVELAMTYLDQGLSVRFVPGAHMLGQMATSARDAGTQRARWEGGRLTLARTWVPRFLRRAITERSATLLDGALELLVPPLASLVLVTGAGLALSLTVWFTAKGAFAGGVAVGWGIVALAQAAYVWTGLILARVPWRVYVRLLGAPLFLAWKLATYATVFGRRQRGGGAEWIRTGRQRLENPVEEPHES